LTLFEADLKHESQPTRNNPTCAASDGLWPERPRRFNASADRSKATNTFASALLSQVFCRRAWSSEQQDRSQRSSLNRSRWHHRFRWPVQNLETIQRPCETSSNRRLERAVKPQRPKTHQLAKRLQLEKQSTKDRVVVVITTVLAARRFTKSTRVSRYHESCAVTELERIAPSG
jgi:hypothetical protein